MQLPNELLVSVFLSDCYLFHPLLLCFRTDLAQADIRACDDDGLAGAVLLRTRGCDEELRIEEFGPKGCHLGEKV